MKNKTVKKTLRDFVSERLIFISIVSLFVCLVFSAFAQAAILPENNLFIKDSSPPIERPRILETLDNRFVNNSADLSENKRRESSNYSNIFDNDCSHTFYSYRPETGQPQNNLHLGIYGGDGFFYLQPNSPINYYCAIPDITVIDPDPNFEFNVTGYQRENSQEHYYSYKVFYHAPVNLQGGPQGVELNVRSNTTNTNNLIVTQDGGCAFKLSGGTVFSRGGGQEQLNLQASPNCPTLSPLTLVSDVPWMSVNGTTLTVEQSASPDTGSRSGYITIQGAGNVPVSLKIIQNSIDGLMPVTPPIHKFYIRTNNGSGSFLGVRG